MLHKTLVVGATTAGSLVLTAPALAGPAGEIPRTGSDLRLNLQDDRDHGDPKPGSDHRLDQLPILLR